MSGSAGVRRRAIRIALVMALVAAVALPAGCGTGLFIPRSDVDRLNVGVYEHHGGEAIDTFLLSDGLPLEIVLTPFSLRMVVWGIGGLQAGDVSAAQFEDVESVQLMEVMFPLAQDAECRAMWVAETADALLVYVAHDDGLYVVDFTEFVSSGGSPAVVADVAIPGGASDVCVSGDRAVAAGSAGVVVFDLADPSDPQLIGTVAMPGDEAVNAVAMAGTNAYAVSDLDVALVDVSGTGPAVIDSFTLGGRSVWAQQDVGSDLVFVSGETSLTCFESDGTALTERGAVAISAPSNDIWSDGMVAAVACGATVDLADVTDLDSPSVPTTLPTSDARGVWGYTSGGPGVFSVADGEAGSFLTDVATSTTHHFNAASSRDVATAVNTIDGNGIAFVADGANGLRVYELLEGFLLFPWYELGGADVRCVDVMGSRVVCGDAMSVVEYDGSDFSTRAVPVTTTPLPFTALDTEFLGTDRYVACGGASALAIVDLDGAYGSRVVTSTAVPETVTALASWGVYGYTGGASGGLAVWDLTDPTIPAFVTSLGTQPGPVEDLHAMGDLLFAALGGGGIRVWDLATPSAPALLDTYTPSMGDAHGVALGGTFAQGAGLAAQQLEDIAVIACDDGVEYVDVSDPTSLTPVGHYAPIPATDVAIDWYTGLPLVVAGEQGLFATSELVLDSPTADVWNVTDGAAYETTCWPQAEVWESSDSLGHPFYWESAGIWENGGWIDGPGTYSYEYGSPGAYDLLAFGRDQMGREASDSALFRILDQERIVGMTRYGTSAAVSERIDGGPTVVIATGKAYPDALSGAPLAYALDAPLLLVGDSIEASVADEITRMGATDTYILGGTGAVPATIEGELTSLGVTTIDRIAGGSRYDTARLVAMELESIAGPFEDVFIATGEDFSDALSCAGIAAFRGSPVLLGRATGLPLETREAIDDLAPSRCIIAGGRAAMADFSFAGTKVRLQGSTRWDTARAVQDWSIANGFDPEHVVVASGRRFPDALSAGVPSAHFAGPLLLVDDPLQAQGTSFLTTNKTHIAILHFIGGTASVPESVRAACYSAIGPVSVPPAEPPPLSAQSVPVGQQRAEALKAQVREMFPDVAEEDLPEWAR